MISDLRKRGYRITPQREMIIETVAQSDHHISAEEILEKLHEHTRAINIATVYRTLDMLCEEGLAHRNDLIEGKMVYASIEHGPHIHLVCRKCKQIFDAEPNILEMLGKELVFKHGFTADLGHLTIFGICEECCEKPLKNSCN
jgi:Fur family ferric uptake transcriptional regulator